MFLVNINYFQYWWANITFHLHQNLIRHFLSFFKISQTYSIALNKWKNVNVASEYR